MARSGLYKSEVKKARDALIAQGKHPSVDAVRIALGNTGSKTTIHKYLKELEEEGGGNDGRKASLSEALQDLVGRLAAQLQEEANVQMDVLQAQYAEQERRHAQAIESLEKALADSHAQFQKVEKTVLAEQAAFIRLRDDMQSESVLRLTAEQQVADLKERLAENEIYRQSLEEKHQHAREALDHYRQSVKDQRDQDVRRHEQQIQQLQAELRQAQQTVVVKQEEVTRLNQDGVRWVAELAHARQALQENQENGRRHILKLEALQSTEHENSHLKSQLAEKENRIAALETDLRTGVTKAEEQAKRGHELELALAASQAKLAAQQEIISQLHTHLAPSDR